MNLTHELMRLDLFEASRPSVDYCRDHRIDFVATIPACGGVYLAEIARYGERRFEPQTGGTLAAWVDVLAEDAETAVDAVAWPVERPDDVMTLAGYAPALGLAAAANAATYCFGRPLKLRTTPLRWLQAGCDGAVLLDGERGARWLLDLPTSTIAVANDAHARRLNRERQALFAGQQFVVPHREQQPEKRAA